MENNNSTDHWAIVKNKWTFLTEEYKPEPVYLGITEKHIKTAYEEGSRHYHNIEHVSKTLSFIEAMREECENWKAVEFAAIFHDFIHDADYHENEFRSANMADLCMRFVNVPKDIIIETKRLIYLTASHGAKDDDKNGIIICDADRSILGARQKEYDRYAKNVGLECEWLSEEEFKEARIAFLKDMLKKGRIFKTDYMHKKLEQRAISNMSRELAKLETIK